MNDFFRFEDKQFSEIRECIDYISDNVLSDSDRTHTIQRVFVSNDDQWGSYSETVQEIEIRIGKPE